MIKFMIAKYDQHYDRQYDKVMTKLMLNKSDDKNYKTPSPHMPEVNRYLKTEGNVFAREILQKVVCQNQSSGRGMFAFGSKVQFILVETGDFQS